MFQILVRILICNRQKLRELMGNSVRLCNNNNNSIHLFIILIIIIITMSTEHDNRKTIIILSPSKKLYEQ
jgi:hypothetical protein